MEGFADEAENRLDQDLLLLASGSRSRHLRRRLKQYQKFITEADAANTEFAQRYKARIVNAAATPDVVGTYVPGSDIDGDELQWAVGLPAVRC